MSLASCRICYDDFPIENLHNPCKCDGSLKYICNDCFKETIICQGHQCGICHSIYSQHPQYSFKEILSQSSQTFYVIASFMTGVLIIFGLLAYPKITLSIILATFVVGLGYIIKHIPFTVYEVIWIYYKLYHNNLDHILSYYKIDSDYYNNNKEKVAEILEKFIFLDYVLIMALYVFCHKFVIRARLNKDAFEKIYTRILIEYFNVRYSHINLPHIDLPLVVMQN